MAKIIKKVRINSDGNLNTTAGKIAEAHLREPDIKARMHARAEKAVAVMLKEIGTPDTKESLIQLAAEFFVHGYFCGMGDMVADILRDRIQLIDETGPQPPDVSLN